MAKGTREKSVARLQRLAKKGHPLKGGKRMTEDGDVEFDRTKPRVRKGMFSRSKMMEKKLKLKPKIKFGPIERMKPLKKKKIKAKKKVDKKRMA